MLYPLSYEGRTENFLHFNHLSQYMPDELKPAEAELDVMHKQQMHVEKPQRIGWRIFGWLMLGGLIGAILVAAFLAYGQPELLLEQLNLRYCG